MSDLFETRTRDGSKGLWPRFARARLGSRLFGACIALLLASASGLALAQGSAGETSADDGSAEVQKTAMARALFEEGLRFVDAQRWADAANRFGRVLELRYSAVAAYNLGLSYARLGKLVRSAEILRKLVADSSLEPKVRDPAVVLLGEVEAGLARLSVEVRGSCEGCSVRVDEQDWPAAVWGVAVPTDPGAHRIELRRGDALLEAKDAKLARGQALQVVLDAEVLDPAQVAALSLSSIDEVGSGSRLDGRVGGAGPGRSDGGLLASPWFWATVGVVVVGSVSAALLLSGSEGGHAAPVPGDFAPAVITGKVKP